MYFNACAATDCGGLLRYFEQVNIALIGESLASNISKSAAQPAACSKITADIANHTGDSTNKGVFFCRRTPNEIKSLPHPAARKKRELDRRDPRPGNRYTALGWHPEIHTTATTAAARHRWGGGFIQPIADKQDMLVKVSPTAVCGK